MSVPEPTASLDVALAHASRLLQSDPALAGEQAAEIIRSVGEHPMAVLLLGVSHSARGDVSRRVSEGTIGRWIFTLNAFDKLTARPLRPMPDAGVRLPTVYGQHAVADIRHPVLAGVLDARSVVHAKGRLGAAFFYDLRKPDSGFLVT